MKGKIIWLMISCLMVAALVLGSCAPAAEPSPTPTPKAKEGPQYGGEFVQCHPQPSTGNDDALAVPWLTHGCKYTNEKLLRGDWAKGLAGTGESKWLLGNWPSMDLLTGCLAERWEVPDPQTIIYHIRKGIHWHDKPPVNGRELVADDVVFSIKRQWEIPESYLSGNFQVGPESVTAPDKWTVVAKLPPGKTQPLLQALSMEMRIVAPEAIKEYGDQRDWRHVVGTGAFIITDEVPGASISFKKNPNYWQDDPVHPGNRLPYIDELKWVTIKDLSTQIASLRTGKVDWLYSLSYEDWEDLQKTNPDMQYMEFLTVAPNMVFMRTDKPELPYKDIRVRQALSMAIDNQAIVDEYYRGKAEVLAWPVVPGYPSLASMYTPLEELPQAARELYEYHPDKAKQLLAEAGYPDGFKAKIICYPAYVDELSIIKEYWAKIGVELELDVKERGVWASIHAKRSHEDMIYRNVAAYKQFEFLLYRPGTKVNLSYADDPKAVAAYDAVNAAWPDEKKQEQIVKDIGPYLNEQAWVIIFPAPYVVRPWSPWVRGYHGEWSVGRLEHGQVANWLWIDQELKKKMGGG